MEAHNIRNTLESLLQPGMTVVEFACGAGFYSSILLRLGASSLTGIDISSTMIGHAKRILYHFIGEGRVQLITEDGAKLQSFAPNGCLEYFDLAFGGWFLNYARTKAELAAMFSNIAHNLKPGGIFIGIVPPPTNDLARLAAPYSQSPLNMTWLRTTFLQDLESGGEPSVRASLNDNKKV